MADRKYDVVLFGATGFTGELTAEYLARAASRETLRWAIAGRSPEKLARLKKRLESINPLCRTELGLLEADVNDAASLDALAKSTRVVITTVGPYIQFGEALVKACAENGTDYVDLTGEPEFVDLMVEKYDEVARQSKARIVNCCGFDSIPHDLGAWFTVTELTQGLSATELARQEIQVEGFVRASGTFSGGTWHSAVTAFSRARDYMKQQKQRNQRKQGAPKSERQIGSVPSRLKFRDELGIWAVPFPTIDPQVVKRSARALTDYGRRFRYGHYVQVKKLPRVLAGAAVVGGIFALAQFGLTRRWLLSLKDQGQGPSESQRQRAWFKVVMLGQCEGRKIRTLVRGGDPGYGETSKMLAEAGLCLALDRRQLSPSYGVITPATAMAKPLVDRLQRAGISFEVLERS